MKKYDGADMWMAGMVGTLIGVLIMITILETLDIECDCDTEPVTQEAQQTKEINNNSELQVLCIDGFSHIRINENAYLLGSRDTWGEIKPLNCGGK